MLSCKLLGERYQVVQVLSQGAFCQTYLARDTHLSNHPTCVVKHFLPSSKYPISIEIRRRLFNRETEALRQLSDYELVPQLLAYFEDSFEFYLVQEFIEGHPLSEELLPGCCWSESKVFQLLEEILDILNFVHNYGLIHRDVKPSNIIRRKQDSRLILIDFGAVKPIWNRLAKGKGKISASDSIEQHTTIAIGTPGYMPNEQQRGKPRPNSDIYALGMIGIQALTGVHPTQLPEDSNTGEVIWKDCAQVSAGLGAVLDKMVRYHFQDRYKSAKDALEALLPLANLNTPPQKSALASSDVLSHLGDRSDPALAETLLPSTELYGLIQESDPASRSVSYNRGSQAHSLQQDIHQVLGNQTEETTISPTVPRKYPLLIGLVVGAVSGLLLMVVSYWSLQIIAPDPQVENFQMQTPRNYR